MSTTSPEAKQAAELPCGCTIEAHDKMISSVFWNKFNGLVQCHKCGEVYEPRTATAKLREELSLIGHQLQLCRSLYREQLAHQQPSTITVRTHDFGSVVVGSATAPDVEKWEVIADNEQDQFCIIKTTRSNTIAANVPYGYAKLTTDAHNAALAQVCEPLVKALESTTKRLELLFVAGIITVDDEIKEARVALTGTKET